MYTAEVPFSIPNANPGYHWIRVADTQAYFETEFNSWSDATAAIIAQASYGDELIVDRASNKFHRVHKASDPSVAGWISAASVTSKKIVTGSKKVTASADEIALAGKGFSEQVENGYKTSNKKLDYSFGPKREGDVSVFISNNKKITAIKNG